MNLTLDKVREALHYDPDTGAFTWKVNKRGHCKAGDLAGARRADGYVRIKLNQSACWAHRLAWFYVHGIWPVHQIDHINGNPSDNRLANLRDVPALINMQNERCARIRTAGGTLLGAHWCRTWQRWKSSIRVGSKKMHLGWFDSEQAAHAAYVAAKRHHHPGCTL